MTIRVMLCDSHSVWRAGLRTILEAAGDIEVVGDLCDGHEAVRLANQLRPDVVLVDTELPGLDGLEVTRQLAGANVADAMRVLVMAGSSTNTVIESVRAGARGYVLKDLPAGALVNAVRAVAAGEAALAPAVAGQVLDHFADCTHQQRAESSEVCIVRLLTGRERSVLRLVARGLTNAGIAKVLGLSIPTVKSHVSNILSKLKLQDRVQAVVVAYESGFVRPGHLAVGALEFGD